jgi:hypothetical protein
MGKGYVMLKDIHEEEEEPTPVLETMSLFLSLLPGRMTRV